MILTIGNLIIKALRCFRRGFDDGGWLVKPIIAPKVVATKNIVYVGVWKNRARAKKIGESAECYFCAMN